MSVLFCKILVSIMLHGGPVGCHPEILKEGTITVRNGKLLIEDWRIACERGGPYRVGHGVWFCSRGVMIDIPNPSEELKASGWAQLLVGHE